MSSSEKSTPSPSVEDESGVLDDLIGTDHTNRKESIVSENKTVESIQTMRRGRGSFVVATKKPKTNKHEDGGHGLFEKRLSAYPTVESPLKQSVSEEPKTEVEESVLVDCINNHFLLTSHNSDAGDSTTKSTENEESPNVMVGTLTSRFEKITFRKNEIIFEEGSTAEHLYVLYRGEVLVRSRNEEEDKKRKNNKDEIGGDGDDDKYKIFGELELLTNSSLYRATAKAISDPCVLFRLGKGDFQSYFLRQHQPKLFQPSPTPETAEEQKKLAEEEKLLGLLRQALPEELSSYFFKDDDEDYDQHIQLWKQLLSERKVRNFRKGDVLIHKSKPVHSLVIITDGLVRAIDNSAGGRSYEDLCIGPGKARISFGWQYVMNNSSLSSTKYRSTVSSSDDDAMVVDQKQTTNNSRRITGTIQAETDGQVLVISKKSFEKVFCHLCYNHENSDKYHHRDGRLLLMDIADLRQRRWKRTQLQQIMVFKDSGLDTTQVNGLLDLMHRCEYGLEETILQAGQKADAAMYFVREGSVRLELNRGRDKQVIQRGGYFGEKNMLLDQNKSDNDKHYQKRSVISAISAAASTKVDVLYLEECRKVLNTTLLGLGMNSSVNSIDESVRWADLRRHKLIGTGSFGQVWLVSTESQVFSEDMRLDGECATKERTERRFFALKVQAKYPLIRSGNADRLISERNVMASLHSPFIMRLFNAFQDDYRLYMITSILPGGNLASTLPEKGFSENTARFYAAGVLEGLTYMHRKHILHRDVKPENILLNAKGYPALIDLGFGKHVLDHNRSQCSFSLFFLQCAQ